jgi:hypothetical protein
MTYDLAVTLYCILTGGLALAMLVAILYMLWDQRER